MPELHVITDMINNEEILEHKVGFVRSSIFVKTNKYPPAPRHFTAEPTFTKHPIRGASRHMAMRLRRPRLPQRHEFLGRARQMSRSHPIAPALRRYRNIVTVLSRGASPRGMSQRGQPAPGGKWIAGIFPGISRKPYRATPGYFLGYSFRETFDKSDFNSDVFQNCSFLPWSRFYEGEILPF